MGSTKRNRFKMNKIKNMCQYCSKLVSSHEVIHIKCIDEFLTKKGYIILAHPFRTQEVRL